MDVGLLYELIEEIITLHLRNVIIIITVMRNRTNKRRTISNNTTYSMISRMPTQIKHLEILVGITNADCISNLRVD